MANYRRLFEALQAEICRSKRTGREFSIVLLDPDGLKQINDQYSHQAGDRALCRLGADPQRLVPVRRHRRATRRDEFAVVLPETCITACQHNARPLNVPLPFCM
jgi:diguanylate cyclase (GGDEF)-like protein